MRNLSPFRSKDLLTLSPCLHFMVNICQFLRPIPNLNPNAFYNFRIAFAPIQFSICNIYPKIQMRTLKDIYVCMPLTKRETKRAECRPNSNVFMDRDEIVVHKNAKKKEVKLQPSWPDKIDQWRIYLYSKIISTDIFL